MAIRETGIHPAQSNILYALRHTIDARFSELLKTTDLTSDNFKFHIRKLMTLGYIEKLDTGTYTLTDRGKEFANRLDEQSGLEYPNPKCSMLMLVWAQTPEGVRVLAHQRQRRPYYGFWGIASAPLLRGKSAVESAHKELLKQTGIRAEFHTMGCSRIIDKNQDGMVLEDKLFVIMSARLDTMPESHDWHGGKSVWMSPEELLAQEKLFPTTSLHLAALDRPVAYTEEICMYGDDEY